MRFALLIPLLLVLASCATGSARSVGLESYRGVYSTHFDGVPDRSGICAVIANQSARPIQWVRLRLQTYGEHEGNAWKSRSHWLYPSAIEPGESAAVEFEDAPYADQIEVTVDRIGTSPRLPRRGRPLIATARCTEDSLAENIGAANNGREASGVQIFPIVRRNYPLFDDDALDDGIADATRP